MSSVFTVAFFVWGVLLCALVAALELLWLRGGSGAFASRGAFLFLTACNLGFFLCTVAAFLFTGGYAFLFVFPIPVLPAVYILLKFWAYGRLPAWFAPESTLLMPWGLAFASLVLAPTLGFAAFHLLQPFNPTQENLEAAIRQHRPNRLKLLLWLSLRAERAMPALVNEAIRYDNLTAARLLVENGADPRAAYWLGQASRPVQWLLVRWMLERGVPVEEINFSGGSQSPSLAEIAVGGAVADLQFCLQKGFQPAQHPRLASQAIEASPSADPADDAALVAKLQLVKTQGVDLHAPGVLEFPPLLLLLAQGRDRPEVVKYLLEQGANANVRSTNPLYPSNRPVIPAGITPLILAAIQGHAASAEVLLRQGADRSLRDRSGKSALDYAQAAPDSSRILTLLRAP